MKQLFPVSFKNFSFPNSRGLFLPGIAVIGAQFGDEGKGKLTDFLAEKADYVVRFQGGNNAGHTLVVDGRQLKLHLLPSGVIYKKKLMIGAGVALDPRVLEEELELLDGDGVDLVIDPRTHIILPWHNVLDEVMESAHGEKHIGTTKRGIGPCYADRALRTGIRFEDLVEETRLKEKINALYPVKKSIIENAYSGKFTHSPESIFSEYARLGKKFAHYLGDVSFKAGEALDQKKTVLFEGAQGAFLDLDFGTYPYVTSSHPLSGGIAIGVGISVNRVERVIGVCKAYTTRVGEGPFPTELTDGLGSRLRDMGAEFGTTTGRPRRVGWLDLPMLRLSQRLNGFTELAVTKLDVLNGMGKLKVAVSYTCFGKEVKFFPYSDHSVQHAKPKYVELNGFEFNTEQIK
ncbi:MAG: adenylosuccinate synthase, partial [Candidatus Diapherotrites archaeon]|nr:adenylosuccinate synthase [Candidatus Diapherotrites archaeon]